MNKIEIKELLRIGLALILMIGLIILNHYFKIDKTLIFVLFLIVYLFIGYKVIFKSIRNIFHGDIFDENFLMLIATIGAFIIKSYEEAIAVMIFYELGEFFQRYAVKKSRNSIKDLMDIRPDYANLLSDDTTNEVYPDEVNIGDTIVVYPGEKVPLDGIVVKGESFIDKKNLTGESKLFSVKEGEEILSGTINIDGTLHIKVTKDFYNSTVSKILHLVENAASLKSKSETFITKFARLYTPIVVILAFFLALIPGIITKEYSEWIYRALNFLVVSCPCALVISVPMSFFASIGRASKEGILIKGSCYIEEFNKVNTFIFDKTGTLTKGEFKVKSVYPEDKYDLVLSLASTAEENSNHPIAKSILTAKEGYSGYNLNEIAGCGVVATKDNDLILCGNDKLMDLYNIAYPKTDQEETYVIVAKNNEFVGIIYLEDQLKDNAKDIIKKLDSKTLILSGDNNKLAKRVSTDLGIDDYKAELLPEDKAIVVEEILKDKTDKDYVCYVGDGINDAPVLMMADVGISMGLMGSDAAIEASDIVLMNDDLESLVKLKKISKKTMRIVTQNIIFAIGIKVLVLILSAFGLSNMWLAIFADVGVAVLAILNSMRCLTK